MAVPPPIRPFEPARLAALRRRDLIGSPAERAYDELVALAARLFGTPLALVNFVDDERQWAKAGVGMAYGDEAPHCDSICAHAIADEDGVLVVPDTEADERFADNPFTLDGLRFYAGATVRTPDGLPLGTLCVGDHAPRTFGAEEVATLRTLADAVSAQVELARQTAVAEARRIELELENDALAALADITSRLARDVEDVDLRDDLCRAACRIAGADQAVLFAADPDGGLTASGASEPALRTLRVERGARSLALEAFGAGAPRFTPDAGVHGWPLVARHGARAAAMQPVLLDGEAIGVLGVFWHEPRAVLGDRVARLLALLAHEAASAFARSARFAELAAQSRTDALTGVLNRRALDEELRRGVLRASREGSPLTVALLDLDHFKAYNDAHGHPAGDALLRDCCLAWSGLLRGADALARFGGEEFVVVLPSCFPPDAARLVERLRAAMPDGQTCSAGIAAWDGSETVESLLCRADAALYAAKDAGRDTVRIR